MKMSTENLLREAPNGDARERILTQALAAEERKNTVLQLLTLRLAQYVVKALVGEDAKCRQCGGVVGHATSCVGHAATEYIQKRMHELNPERRRTNGERRAALRAKREREELDQRQAEAEEAAKKPRKPTARDEADLEWLKSGGKKGANHE